MRQMSYPILSSLTIRTNTFLFKDTMDHIYDYFIDFFLFKEAFKCSTPYIVTMTKGNRLNEEGSEFTIELSKLVTIKMLVCNVIITDNYREHTFKAIHITNIKAYFSIITKFYYNTCEDETMVITQKHFPDSFSQLLLKNNYVEIKGHYHVELIRKLQKLPRKLKQAEAITINASIDDIWGIVCNYRSMFGMLNIDECSILNYDQSKKSTESRRIILINRKDEYTTDVDIRVECNREERRKISYETCGDKAKVVKQRVIFVVRMIGDYSCVINVKHWFYDTIPYEHYCMMKAVKKCYMLRLKYIIEEANRNQARKIASYSCLSSNMAIMSTN